MSFYNMLFGVNDQADLLLAVIGLKKNDIERFRDVHVEDDGKTIAVYTRTGGGNRAYYPNLTMRKLPTWQGSEDDDFDCTYCTDRFAVPEKFVEDVQNLGDILSHGLRAEFAQHLAATLRREKTDGDKAAAAYDAEERALARTAHVKANGHTFVPYDDYAMQKALELAEANEGRLRSCRGILPLVLKVKRRFPPLPEREGGRRPAAHGTGRNLLSLGDRRSVLGALPREMGGEVPEGHSRDRESRAQSAQPEARVKVTVPRETQESSGSTGENDG